MSSNFPEDLTLGYGLVALCHHTGARSAWLQKGSSLIDSNLPFADSRIEKMVAIIDEMATSYAHVGREMETVCFGFHDYLLLCICERSLRVVLLFSADRDELTTAIIDARRFLRKNRPKILAGFEETQAIFLKARENSPSPDTTPVPLPQPSAWADLFPKIKELLSEAVSEEQTNKLIEKTLKDHPLSKNPNSQEITEFSHYLFAKIPVPSKREKILKKLDTLLTD